MPRGDYGAYSPGRGSFGSPELATRGYYGPHARSLLGANAILPHAPGDTEDEIEQIHGELMQFGQQLHDHVFTKGNDQLLPGANPGLVAFYKSVWRPFMQDWLNWHKIHGANGPMMQNMPFSGAWDRAQDYRDKLIGYRLAAIAAGFNIKGPAPIAPRKDTDLGEEIGKGIKEIGSFMKVALYGALAIGGVVALTSVASHIKSGRDPVETYAGLARARRAQVPTATAFVKAGGRR